MIIEDLLWEFDPSPMGLPCGLKGVLEGVNWLQECEPCDIRFLGVVDTVGVIFDLRTGLFGEDWGAPADVAVLVVQGVRQLNSPSIRDAMVKWETIIDERGWACQIGQVHTPGLIEIKGTRASLYGGVIPGFPDCQPLLGTSDLNVIRAGWPSWQSEFVATIEPEHWPTLDS